MKSIFAALRIHPLSEENESVLVPSRFTNPFDYEPHPLCIDAFARVREYLATKPEWDRELSLGKMIGVLVVRFESKLGFLAAFSGTLADSSNHEFFVPPVFDFLAMDSFFRREEAKIVEVNNEIARLESDEALCAEIQSLKSKIAQLQEKVACEETKVRNAKANRDTIRKVGVSEEVNRQLIQESQFQKAELRRLKKSVNDEIKVLDDVIFSLTSTIRTLKKKRKAMSNALQDWLFQNFTFFNAIGETKSLYDIFLVDNKRVPPSGSGECCAPRLLQWAYTNKLEPVCMAEFWVGNSPVGEIRYDGYSYPACKNKCEPILNFMLQGLELDVDREAEPIDSLPVIFEDEYLIAINKLQGLLSVPGKNGQLSALEILCRQTGLNEIKAIHRLDMATSGILLFAKKETYYKEFQKLFAQRNVCKTYLALLDGIVEKSEGVIDLPLCPDYSHRPCQMVSYEQGKPSTTRFEVISFSDGMTRIHFYPLTGRTHQLRVHSASQYGLNMPIVGDQLYGKRADRLYLHAERVRFRHPYTNELVDIECPSDF